MQCLPVEASTTWGVTVLFYGKCIGYRANPSKSWLIVKKDQEERANRVFKNTNSDPSAGLNITTNGRKHLGAALGTEEFKNEYIDNKIEQWSEEIKVLANIAKTEPHLAYAAFTHGYKHKFTYFMRTIPNISENMKKLDQVIDEILITAIFNGKRLSELDRQLIALPVKCGGMAMPIVSTMSDVQYSNSRSLTNNLVSSIVKQNEVLDIDQSELIKVKNEIKTNSQQKIGEELLHIKIQMSNERLKIMEANMDYGAGFWLNALPIKDQGFYLDKRSFWDNIYFRYGFSLP